jgi:hypothetical protein
VLFVKIGYLAPDGRIKSDDQTSLVVDENGSAERFWTIIDMLIIAVREVDHEANL